MLLKFCSGVAMSYTEALKTHFGFDGFRGGQEDIVNTIMSGTSALAVMPTGAGKSLCYQLPACLLPGLTVVISPLIALMKDQVDSARARGLKASCIHSGLSWPEQQQVLQDIAQGRLDLIYIAPERFQSEAFREALSSTTISLLAIDEAHCISQWGHDFRPDYLEIGTFRKFLNEPVTLALTATATPEVQQDILRQLQIQNARVIVSGFERENLFFEVIPVDSEESKIRVLEEMLRAREGQVSVVYCATRKQVDLVSGRLKRAGFLVGAYHAGLKDFERESVQDMFMAGDLPVLVATNAFGMGVDKSDVRAIVHMNFPGSVEGYYQEAGRAGRDGEPASCTVLYSPKDKGIHQFFLDVSYPSATLVMSVWSEVRRLGLGTHSMGADVISRYLSKSSRKTVSHPGAVEAAMRVLKTAGHIDFGIRDGFPWIACLDLARSRDLRVDWDQLKLRRDIAYRQTQDMVRYCESKKCRQVNLLKYFKSTSSFGKRCGHCDNCTGTNAPVAKRPVVEIEDDYQTLVRKALSGVARCRGRVQADLVAAMLRGSNAQKLSSKRLDQLSTYGILSSLDAPRIHELLVQLEDYRLVVKSQDFLALTPAGADVMRGEKEVPDGLRAAPFNRAS